MPVNKEGGQGTQKAGQPNQGTDQNIRNQDQQRDQGGQRNKESENQQGRSGSGQPKR